MSSRYTSCPWRKRIPRTPLNLKCASLCVPFRFFSVIRCRAVHVSVLFILCIFSDTCLFHRLIFVVRSSPCGISEILLFSKKCSCPFRMQVGFKSKPACHGDTLRTSLRRGVSSYVRSALSSGILRYPAHLCDCSHLS